MTNYPTSNAVCYRW